MDKFKLQSPITGSRNVKKIGSIKNDFVLNKYLEQYSIDVSSLIGKDDIGVYRCLDTDYGFFYPFNTEGDDFFYRNLQRDPYYYLPEKWEHNILINKIGKNSKVLEFGCGPGYFLKRLKKKGISSFGLEKNKLVVKRAQGEGLSVFDDEIFFEEKKREFDFVCSFQVLEHVADVKFFLDSMISFLKKDGRLFISVPNNDSFIKDDKENILNMPPHHMGLWSKNSLRNLEKYFDIEFVENYFEPLPVNHIGYFYRIMFGSRLLCIPVIGKFVNYIFIFPICAIILIFRKKIKGTTIVAEYVKKV